MDGRTDGAGIKVPQQSLCGGQNTINMEEYMMINNTGHLPSLLE